MSVGEWGQRIGSALTGTYSNAPFTPLNEDEYCSFSCGSAKEIVAKGIARVSKTGNLNVMKEFHCSIGGYLPSGLDRCRMIEAAPRVDRDRNDPAEGEEANYEVAKRAEMVIQLRGSDEQPVP